MTSTSYFLVRWCDAEAKAFHARRDADAWRKEAEKLRDEAARHAASSGCRNRGTGDRASGLLDFHALWRVPEGCRGPRRPRRRGRPAPAPTGTSGPPACHTRQPRWQAAATAPSASRGRRAARRPPRRRPRFYRRARRDFNRRRMPGTFTV